MLDISDKLAQKIARNEVRTATMYTLCIHQYDDDNAIAAKRIITDLS